MEYIIIPLLVLGAVIFLWCHLKKSIKDGDCDCSSCIKPCSKVQEHKNKHEQ